MQMRAFSSFFCHAFICIIPSFLCIYSSLQNIFEAIVQPVFKWNEALSYVQKDIQNVLMYGNNKNIGN